MSYRVPALLDGSAAADGNAITQPAGSWLNGTDNTYNFTPVTTAPWVRTAGFLGAVNCNGTQLPIVVNRMLDSGYVGNQISLLARIRNVNSDVAARNLFALDAGSTVTEFIQFYVDVDKDIVVFTTTSHVLAAAYYSPVVAADWHDFLIVVDGLVARLYVDGVQIGTDIAIAEERFWEDFSRARLLTHPTNGSNRFLGDCARITVYPSAITPSQVDTAPTALDIRFRSDRIEDESCRIPTIMLPSGVTSLTRTIPTNYAEGNALPPGMTHSTNGSGFEHKFILEDYDE